MGQRLIQRHADHVGSIAIMGTTVPYRAYSLLDAARDDGGESEQLPASQSKLKIRSEAAKDE